MPRGRKHAPEQILAVLRRIDGGELARMLLLRSRTLEKRVANLNARQKLSVELVANGLLPALCLSARFDPGLHGVSQWAGAAWMLFRVQAGRS